VYGKTLDMNYTHILFDHPEYDLDTVFLLDKVQMHQEIGEADAKRLRSLNLIGGRRPNLFVSAKYDEAGKSPIGDIGDKANVTNRVTKNVTNHTAKTVTEISDIQNQIIEIIRDIPNINARLSEEKPLCARSTVN
jgi:hypothetical protein